MRRWDRLLMVALCLAVPVGCSVLRVGPAAEIMDLEQQTDAEKNLETIRAMQRDLHRPGDAPEFPVAPRSHSDAKDQPVEPQASVAPAPVSPAPSAAVTRDKPVVQAAPPLIARPGPPDRPVPAYTIPAPVGPGEPGSVRCVPDGMGGQRCLRP